MSTVPIFDAIKAGAAPLLERLSFIDIPITGDSNVSLCNAIEEGAFSKLQELDFHSYMSVQKLNGPDVLNVVNAMARSPHHFEHMKSVRIYCVCGFGWEGARALSSFLQAGACPSLENLSLEDTRILDDGVMSFAAALKDGMPCS